jgi:hypothetical protein
LKRWRLTSAALFGALALTAFANVTGGPEEKGAFKASVPQKWEVQVPVTAPIRLAAAPEGGRMIPIPHAGGPGFIAEVDGPSLAVDTNGDGKVDEKVKGLGGVVSLRGKNADGKAFTYTVRVLKDGAEWALAPGAVMVGKIAGAEVKFIDLNVNGRFDEVGVDAMVTGKGDAASLLSKVANLGGKLFQITVTADGASATATPFEGKSGTLNLAKGWKSEGAELASAVVVSLDNEMSFELSDARSGLLVPEGEYKFVHGFARKGSESVKIRGGEGMKPYKVEADRTTAASWGGAVEMDFSFTIVKDLVTVPPTLLYRGKGGEEYYEFKPDAKSPLIVVTDAETGVVVREGRFGGC